MLRKGKNKQILLMIKRKMKNCVLFLQLARLCVNFVEKLATNVNEKSCKTSKTRRHCGSAASSKKVDEVSSTIIIIKSLSSLCQRIAA